jgi:hypothetical protein
MRRADTQHQGKHDPGDTQEGTHHRPDREDRTVILRLFARAPSRRAAGARRARQGRSKDGG